MKMPKQSINTNKKADTSSTSQTAKQTVTSNSEPSSVTQLQHVLANPNSHVSPGHIMQLQKTIGNRAVMQLMKTRMSEKSHLPGLQRVEQNSIPLMSNGNVSQNHSHVLQRKIVELEEGYVALDEEEESIVNDGTIKYKVLHKNEKGMYWLEDNWGDVIVYDSKLNQKNSMAALDDLKGKTDMSNWNSGKKELAHAHHKFPKSGLAWIFELMTDKQKEKLRGTLFLDKKAGAPAVARLRSLLISADYNGGKVSSDHRLDDPHNNRDKSAKGEEYLDLVHNEGEEGSLTPRSSEVVGLAQDVVQQIYLRYQLHQLSEERETKFELTDEEADRVIGHLRRAEELHYAIEDEPTKPSHSTGEAWDEVEDGTYKKKPVPAIHVEATEEERSETYQKDKQAEDLKRRSAGRDRKETIRLWLEWLREPPKNKKEAVMKDDYTKANILFINGSKKGEKLGVAADFYWRSKLIWYMEGREGYTEETIEWLDDLFTKSH